VRKLSRPEVYKLANDWIGVSGGYLGDFTYASHREFYPYYCDLDIDPEQYGGSTRERFLKVLENAEPEQQARIVRGVLTKFPPGSSSQRDEKRGDEWLRIADELEAVGKPARAAPEPVAERHQGVSRPMHAEAIEAAPRREATAARPARPARKDSVFVVHGRDRRLAKELFRFLRALNVQPLEWNSLIEMTGKAAPHISEILDVGFKSATAVVVLFTPDDVGRLREDLRTSDDPESDRRLTGQARLNVIFEAGLAFGTHPDRTVLIQIGTVRPFSDLAGRHVVKLSNSPRSRRELATKLKNAGCAIDDSGTDWLEEGDFELS
jgi:predicted nucleotide-binding protein